MGPALPGAWLLGAELCVFPQNLYAGALVPGPQNDTGFGLRAFKEGIRLK